jgi:hypothetical protein
MQAEGGNRIGHREFPVGEGADHDLEAMRHPFQAIGQFDERGAGCRGLAKLEDDLRSMRGCTAPVSDCAPWLSSAKRTVVYIGAQVGMRASSMMP